MRSASLYGRTRVRSVRWHAVPARLPTACASTATTLDAYPRPRNSGGVAAVSQHLLDSGRKFCFLFTDLANPTSNKIYQQIGYEPVSDFRHWNISNGVSA